MGGIRTVLLDIGGVLADVDWDASGAIWQTWTGRPGAELRAALFAAGEKDALDRGALAPATFLARAAERLGVPGREDRLAEVYAALLTPRIEAFSALAAVPPAIGLGLLSNIDPLHFAAFSSRVPPGQRFEPAVLSFRIGARKPETAIFEAALAALGAPEPSTVMIVDDRPENRAAARERGLCSADGSTLTRLRDVVASLRS